MKSKSILKKETY